MAEVRVTAKAIEGLMKPRSIAFVGVSAKGGAGAKMMESAKLAGFDGKIWPVNPGAKEIGGFACYPSLAALPATPDCVVVAVKAEAVLGVVGEAAAKGTRAVLVVSEGFADAATDEGRALQARLVELATEKGVVVAGPNCMGISSFANKSAATMADIPATAVAGGISLVSQSGGLMNAVAEFAGNRGIGLNYLISNGNGAVLEVADYIDYLVDDPGTRVIAVIMEGARDGRKFRAAIERASRVKPVVVLKLGRSAFGQAATLAHTGTLAGKHEAFAALFKQNGVALVESIDELVETAALLDLAPLPSGDRVLMFTVSGGATSLIGDLGDRAGINFPPVGDATNAKLQMILGVDRHFGNPLDTVGMPRLQAERNMTAVLEALEADDGIDVVGLVLGMRGDGAKSHQHLIDQLAEAQARMSKPVMVVSFMSTGLTRLWRGFGQKSGVPIIEDLQRGLKAVGHLVHYGTFRRGLAASSDRSSGGRGRASGQAKSVHDAVGAYGEAATLTEAQSKAILGEAGLPVTREILARTPAEAAKAAAEIGGVVAVKVQSPDIPHKSDVGGVVLGVKTPAAAEEAARLVLERSAKACPDADIHGVLVQEMVTDGTELILGMTYDEQFGPMVVLGAGGVMVEIFKDAAVRLPPFGADEVRGMIGELKASKMLEGFRGTAPRDIEALVETCIAFGKFVAETDGQFAAIDLNPVFVLNKGRGVRIADALIVPRGKEKSHAGH